MLYLYRSLIDCGNNSSFQAQQLPVSKVHGHTEAFCVSIGSTNPYMMQASMSYRKAAALTACGAQQHVAHSDSDSMSGTAAWSVLNA